MHLVRLVFAASLIAACSATAPPPGSSDVAGAAGVGGASAATGGSDGGQAPAPNAGSGGSAGTTGTAGKGGDAGAGQSGAAQGGQAPGGAEAGGAEAGGAEAGGTEAGGAEQGEAGQAGSAQAGNGGTEAVGQAGGGGTPTPFGGGGDSGAGGAETCDLTFVEPDTGLDCTSINYIVGAGSCDGCDRGVALYTCNGTATPNSPGCSVLESAGKGYFCCEKSLCTPQPGGCPGAVRYHCPTDVTAPKSCTKLGGDMTSYCCPT
jgi:hypothetical protein